jgi:MFS family permease
MIDPLLYQRLADAVLVLHFALVAFVVGGLVAILLGNALGWRWANGRGFRIAHLAAIVIVAAEAWLGTTCPLTTLELWLRAKSDVNTGLAYSDSFVGYWLHRLLFYSAPPWVFVLAYSVFGLLVMAAWFRFPPRSKRRAAPDSPIVPTDHR